MMIARLLIFSACAVLAASAHAQFPAPYPDKPIRIIVPSAPGAGTDNVVRTIAPGLTRALGQQIVIDNRVGAAGAIGARLAARAAPDGYTLLATYATHATNLAMMKDPGYDLEREFAPISLTVLITNLMVAHPSLPVRNVKQLIALARAKPGALQYASGSYGASAHLSMALFLSMTKTKMLNVPYKGVGPAVVAVVAGEVPLLLASMSSSIGHVRGKRLVALGVTSAQRVSGAPEIPTIAEAGVPGYQADNWSGLLAPAGTPPAIVTRLHAAVVQALQDPEVKKRFVDEGGAAAPSRTPEEFGAMIRSEIRKWAKVVKDAGLKNQ
jgi:tripartite-type tricarboxylate transporter receptor subunit TctC